MTVSVRLNLDLHVPRIIETLQYVLQLSVAMDCTKERRNAMMATT